MQKQTLSTTEKEAKAAAIPLLRDFTFFGNRRAKRYNDLSHPEERRCP